jgi:hypothetical protein
MSATVITPIGTEEEGTPDIATVPALRETPIRKFSGRVQPGRTEYRIVHNLGSLDVLVQTRIAGRIREGGISILDENTVQLVFGGTLNEEMDVVVIG